MLLNKLDWMVLTRWFIKTIKFYMILISCFPDVIDQSMGHPFIVGQKYQKANHQVLYLLI